MQQTLFNQLSKNNISPNQYAVLWYRKNNIKCPVVSNIEGEARILQLNGLLDIDFKLTNRGEELLAHIEKLFRKTKPTGPDILGDGYTQQIITYRDKFPPGKKASPKEVTDKFVKFFTQYRDQGIDWDTIQKATDIYISEQHQFHYKAGNFITVKREGTDTWPLYEYCEKVLSGEQLIHEPSIWNIR